jgi:hypothetical protein
MAKVKEKRAHHGFSALGERRQIYGGFLKLPGKGFARKAAKRGLKTGS